jgi:hypothetical protein
MTFESNHDHANDIPFELQMSNMGKALGGWAQKLGWNDTRAARVSKVLLTEADNACGSRIASLHGTLPVIFSRCLVTLRKIVSGS